MRLKACLRAYPYESIISYMVRVSNANQISLLQLWALCKTQTAHFPSLSDIRTLIFHAGNLIDIKKLSDMTGLSTEDILGMTLHNLVVKFKADNSPRARMVSGMLRTEYYYCQKCLQEKPFHSLLWSIADVHICYSHHVALQSKCVHCGKKINLKEVLDFSRCPYCHKKLTDKGCLNADYGETIDMQKQEWLVRIYMFLLSANGFHNDRKNLAIRFLYILNQCKPVFDRKTVQEALQDESYRLPTLLQHARDSLSYKRTLELPFLLKTLYANGSTMEQLFMLEVPAEFQKSITEKKKPLKDKLSCLAPWCESYGHPSSLHKTGTSFKRKDEGSLKYYLICSACGCQYAMNLNGQLIERTKFIGIYDFLKTIRSRTVSLKALSAASGYSTNDLKRGLSYFDSRGVFRFENYHISLDKQKLSLFMEAVRAGEAIKQIRKWELWHSEYEFLYYRYHRDVLAVMRKRTKERIRSPRKDDKLTEVIEPILNAMLRDDIDISIKEVCKRAHICPETLRLWGGMPLVASVKSKQAQARLAIKKTLVYETFQAYLDSHVGMKISAEEIYRHLDILRTVLWRTAPELTAYIHARLKEHNKMLSSNDFRQ